MKPIPIFLFFALVASIAPRVSAISPDVEKTRQLLAVVQSDSVSSERARALQQLALVASPDSVPALTPLLGHPELGQYARDVLEQMPDASAGEALRAAVSRLGGRSLVGVVNSLGVRRDAKAVDALSRLAIDRTSVAAEAALLALGRIATPEAVRLVEDVALRGPRELRHIAAEACILAAERLAQQGQRAAALALFAAVRHADPPRSLQLTSIRGAILAAGADDLTLLLEQLHAKDPEIRAIALFSIRDMGGTGVTPILVRELDRFDPTMQAPLIDALVDRGEAGLLDWVETRAESNNEEVMLASIRALGAIGRASSVRILVKVLRGSEGPAITHAALSALAAVRAPETDAVLLNSLAQAEPPLQIQLLGVLGERKTGATSELLRLAQGADLDVGRAAWRALSLAAGPSDLPAMIQRAVAVQDESVKTLADRAVVTTSMKAIEPQARVEPVLTAFRQASEMATKEALLRPLGATVRLTGGSHEAFLAVRTLLGQPSGSLRTAAIRCLAEWPDATPATTLLAIAGQDHARTVESEVALHGAIRMTTRVAAGREVSPLNVMECFALANKAVRTRAEKLMIVSGLGNVNRSEAVAMLKPYLDDPEVQPEAALAVVKIASATMTSNPAGGTRAMLEKISAMEVDEELRLKAAQLAMIKPSAAVAGVAAPSRDRPSGKTATAEPLFNGRDLAGWDGDPAIWRVRGGLIVGGWLEGTPRSEFLATKRRFGNFVLRLDYLLAGAKGCNGGVQFRSLRLSDPPNGMIGYQADIGKGYSGSLYDESRRKKFLVRAPAELIQRLEKPGDWNHYEIRCEGPRVELRLNGEVTVSYLEEDATLVPEGLIALQIHGNCKGEISFRNLTLEPLP